MYTYEPLTQCTLKQHCVNGLLAKYLGHRILLTLQTTHHAHYVFACKALVNVDAMWSL